jgi:hypothetical protein
MKTIPLFFLLSGLALPPAFAATVPASPFPPIRADQARANEGQNVTVQGVATAHLADARLGYYIDLDGNGPSPVFAGYVPNENLQQFPPLQTLDGHVVAITGIIRVREGYPIITMTDASQLRIVR